MNFELPPELSGLRQQVRTFVDEKVIPAERRILEEDREGKLDTVRALQAAAPGATGRTG